MATVHAPARPGGKRVMYVKGAPDRIMPMCAGQLRGEGIRHLSEGAALDPLDCDHWMRAQEHLSSKGLRVLALCRGEVEDGEDLSGLNPETLRQRVPSLAFVALLAILDPPREEVIEAVKVAHTAGICVKMITGG